MPECLIRMYSIALNSTLMDKNEEREYELFQRIPFTIQSYTFAVLWKKLFMLLGLNLWLKKPHQK